MKYCVLLLALLPVTLAAADHAQERQRFQRLYSAAAGGEAVPEAQAKILRGYPLYPYLEYPRLVARVGELPITDVHTFFAAYPDSLLAARLRTAWLRELARRGQWDLFAEDYTSQTDPELQCDALAIPLRRDEPTTPDRLAPVRAVWKSGKATPAVCEPVFEQLRHQGVLTSANVWSRLLSAAQIGNLALAEEIARRYATREDQSHAQLLVRALGAPGNVLVQKGLTQDSSRIRTIVGSAIARLARIDLSRATQAWHAARQRYHFTPDEAGPTWRAIALAAVAKEDPRRMEYLVAIPASSVDEKVEQAQLRLQRRSR